MAGNGQNFVSAPFSLLNRKLHPLYDADRLSAILCLDASRWRKGAGAFMVNEVSQYRSS